MRIFGISTSLWLYIYRHYHSKVPTAFEINLINNKNLKKVKCSRDGYLTDDGDKDFLMNPKWKFRPKIAFIDSTINVLTCKDHNGGGTCMMIHACRWKHHLPYN